MTLEQGGGGVGERGGGADDLEFTTQEVTGEEKCKQPRFLPPELAG